MPYKRMLDDLKQHFTKIDFEQIPREQNRAADAMATIASLIDLPPNETCYEFLVDNLLVPSYEIMPTEMICVVGPESQLYDGTLLRCLESGEAQIVLWEVHEGICGPHASGPTLAKKLIRTGYYWPNMEKDSYQFVKKCKQCQIHGDLIHAPAQELQPLASPWPFCQRGLDLIGKIHPLSSNGHKFIITATEYFTKWIEAVPLTQVTGKQIATFILNYIICRYGILVSIITDNGCPFKNQDVCELCDHFHISHHFSTPYYLQGNGQAEASNKTILKILKKTVDDASRNWHIQLNLALWAYRTSVHTPTGATPYSLVYGTEAILPIEVELPSLQVSLKNIISDEDYRVSRLQELEILDERRQIAFNHLKAYQQQMSHSYNHKVKPRTFEVGDLVLRENPINQQDREKKGKFEPNWLGPYIILVAYGSGAYQLSTTEGEPLEDPINNMHLRRFYT
ncbi:hypothetical protein SUGI_0296430 [Cryptomeria japonica]|nr:hypothetical protein SUGI_0296430 [Cryptomeria japonica]